MKQQSLDIHPQFDSSYCMVQAKLRTRLLPRKFVYNLDEKTRKLPDSVSAKNQWSRSHWKCNLIRYRRLRTSCIFPALLLLIFTLCILVRHVVFRSCRNSPIKKSVLLLSTTLLPAIHNASSSTSLLFPHLSHFFIRLHCSSCAQLSQSSESVQFVQHSFQICPDCTPLATF